MAKLPNIVLFLFLLIAGCGKQAEHADSLERFEVVDEYDGDRDFSVDPRVKWSSLDITFSYVPDGTLWKNGQFSQCGTALTDGHSEINRAFQTWAKYSRVKFRFVSDDGSPYGAIGKGQGDPRFGDIRIGCIPLSGSTIGVTTMCRGASRNTICGDMALSPTAVGKSYLYSLVLHESGHSLGLNHSTDPNSIMAPSLRKMNDLSADDIAAIQTQYGAPATSTQVSPVSPTLTPAPNPIVSSVKTIRWTPQTWATFQVLYVFKDPGQSWTDLALQRFFIGNVASDWRDDARQLTPGKYISAVLSYSANEGSRWGSIERFTIP